MKLDVSAPDRQSLRALAAALAAVSVAACAAATTPFAARDAGREAAVDPQACLAAPPDGGPIVLAGGGIVCGSDRDCPAGLQCFYEVPGCSPSQYCGGCLVVSELADGEIVNPYCACDGRTLGLGGPPENVRFRAWGACDAGVPDP